MIMKKRAKKIVVENLLTDEDRFKIFWNAIDDEIKRRMK